MRTAGVLALLVAAACVSAEAVVSAAPWPLSAAKFSIQSIDGLAKQTQEFSASSTAADAPTVALEADDVIRLTFTLEGGKDEHPHQVAAVLVDEAVPTVQQTFLIPVKPATGKATWSVRADRLPQQLLQHIGATKSGAQEHLTLRLLLGGYGSGHKSASIPVAKVRLPDALIATGTQQAQGAAGTKSASSVRASKLATFGFLPHREHKHTFAQPPTERMPAKAVSGLAALVTVAMPWAFFAVVLVPVLGLHSLPLTSKGTGRTAPLLATIVGLEALALQYWLRLTLFEMIPYLVGGGAVAVFTGRTALIELRRRRATASA